jgi:hypothetical protein
MLIPACSRSLQAQNSLPAISQRYWDEKLSPTPLNGAVRLSQILLNGAVKLSQILLNGAVKLSPLPLNGDVRLSLLPPNGVVKLSLHHLHGDESLKRTPTLHLPGEGKPNNLHLPLGKHPFVMGELGR